jgi:hypothetical protein
MYHMNIPPWAILSVRPIQLVASRLIAASPKMALQGFSIDRSDDGKRRGQVLFGCESPDGPIFAAWQWAEWVPGVVCIEDPCAVLSNVAIVDDRGAPCSWTMQVAHINSLVYLLRWQQVVLERLVEREELPIAA